MPFKRAAALIRTIHRRRRSRRRVGRAREADHRLFNIASFGGREKRVARPVHATGASQHLVVPAAGDDAALDSGHDDLSPAVPCAPPLRRGSGQAWAKAKGCWMRATVATVERLLTLPA